MFPTLVVNQFVMACLCNVMNNNTRSRSHRLRISSKFHLGTSNISEKIVQLYAECV